MAISMYVKLVGWFVVVCGLLSIQALAETHYYDFAIKEASYTRLCHTKNILTVNGEFPGPTISVRKGDDAFVRVQNDAEYNITIHWHGVDQPRNPWSDGPEYITQCPIRPGNNFTYHVQFTVEEGTVWWHAHSSTDRATVHGPIIIHPRNGSTFPFPKPHREIPIILGEWSIASVSQIQAEALREGKAPNISDGFTINGRLGHLYPCSTKPADIFSAVVEQGKIYLLRVINAALNADFFFAVAGHKLTVVGTDASYTKPWTTDYIMISPGQTMDLLLKADQPAGRYYMAARGYDPPGTVSYDNTTTTGILKYMTAGRLPSSSPQFPYLPINNDTASAVNFTDGLRSLASKEHPVDVPQTVDEQIIMVVSVNEMPCVPEGTCQGPNGTRLATSLNNISFVTPTISVLKAYYENITGVYETGFPSEPPLYYNFTSSDIPQSLYFPKKATMVRVVEYNTKLEIVLQGTSLVGAGNHPMHIHGQSFYVVGRGLGNFDKEKDPSNYNLVDPPYENTVGFQPAGWTAIRFKATNPGVWFMHCHFDRHVAIGMDTVFIVKNGATPDAQMLPPPPNMPSC